MFWSEFYIRLSLEGEYKVKKKKFESGVDFKGLLAIFPYSADFKDRIFELPR